jgi:hypothetical protein
MKNIDFSFLKRWYFYSGAAISAIIILGISFFDFLATTKPYVFLICTAILGAMISIIVDKKIEMKNACINKIEEEKKNEENKLLHFPKSYPVVSNKIIPTFYENSKSSGNFNISHNNTIDKIIKSPIDYTHETLSGNQAPIFNPNEKYLEDIYSEELSHIVAITAENPNLWLDPTLCFYMINCCAVSLVNKFNNSNKTVSKLKICDFNNDITYENFVKTESNVILKRLKEKKDLENFEFIRFFIFNKEQEYCLKDTVFPSLKASQDLFRIKSFFIQDDKLKLNLKTEYRTYLSFIDDIWDRIAQHHNFNPADEEQKKIISIIENRKLKHIPEFLILFKKNKEIIIHTYISGKAYTTPLGNHTTGVHDDYSAAKSLIAYLANCRIKNSKCDWYPEYNDNVKTLNIRKSYIDLD